MNSKKAFTLIELLVVIAIIAILAAILFPVFAQAKLAAKKVVSISNIKQNSLAVLMYNTDYDDTFDVGATGCWFYPGVQGSQPGGGWSWDIYPYEKSLAILLDPTDPKNTNNWYSWMFPPNNPTVSISYVSNGFLWQDRNNGWSTRVAGVMGFQDSSGQCGNTWMTSSITSEANVTQPFATIMMAARYGGNDIWGQGDLVSGVNWWDNGSGGAGLIPNGSLDPTQSYTAKDANGQTYIVNKDQRNGAIAVPYSNQSPFAFCDGHAKAMTPIATNPNPTGTYINAPDLGLFPSGHDSQNMWDAYR
jgi:prepilin-type N-terminal cleavage/methylation domain-containing protein/prepilin-type processing-associated H-X9-DG protein